MNTQFIEKYCTHDRKDGDCYENSSGVAAHRIDLWPNVRESAARVWRRMDSLVRLYLYIFYGQGNGLLAVDVIESVFLAKGCGYTDGAGSLHDVGIGCKGCNGTTDELW